MAWKIEFDSDVEKDLKKLGHTAQKRIIKFLKEKIMTSDDPRNYGKALTECTNPKCQEHAVLVGEGGVQTDYYHAPNGEPICDTYDYFFPSFFGV